MSKIFSLGLAFVIGVGTPSTLGAYYGTKKTIWDIVSEYAIPNFSDKREDSSFVEIWKKLRINLTSNNSVKDESLKKLKQEGNDDSGEKLMKWCFEKYEEVYWSWFLSENSTLKDDVKVVCTQTIKSQLADKAIEFSEGKPNKNESKFKEKISKLKDHNHKESTLEKELIEIKDSVNPEEKWEKLESWCKKIYEKGYQGSSSNRWKLASVYCKKDS